MKSSPDVETVSAESLFLITRATVSLESFLIRSVLKNEAQEYKLQIRFVNE